MLSTQHACHLGRQAPEGLAFGVHEVPFLLHIGWFEIVGGVLLLSGFLTRLIAVPFIIEMLVAMASTKISLYLGTSPLPLPPVPPQIGLWAVLHEIRSEFAQLSTCAFLLIVGPGRWSIDALLVRRRRHARLATSGFGSEAAGGLVDNVSHI